MRRSLSPLLLLLLRITRGLGGWFGVGVRAFSGLFGVGVGGLGGWFRVGVGGLGGWVGDGVDGGVVEWLCGEKNITHNHLRMYLTIECTRCLRRSTSSSVEISCKK